MRRFDGKPREFDDPERRPGEPWIAHLSPEAHERLIAELDELRERPEQFARAAVLSQVLAKSYMEDRNEYIAAAVREHCNVSALAQALGLSRQQVYAIAQQAPHRGAS